jgi:hypothetical protein
VNGIPSFQYTVFDLFVLFWIDLLVLGMGMRERGWFGSIDTPLFQVFKPALVFCL